MSTNHISQQIELRLQTLSVKPRDEAVLNKEDDERISLALASVAGFSSLLNRRMRQFISTQETSRPSVEVHRKGKNSVCSRRIKEYNSKITLDNFHVTNPTKKES